MTGQGIAQIVFYAVVLIALAYPLGLYMARVYAASVGGALRLLGAVERGFCRLVRTDRAASRTGRATRRRVLVFSVLFSAAALRDPARCRAHLFLNPDDLQGVPSHIALNTDGELRHEHELAVLRRRVHDVVPDPDGRAGRAEVRLGGGRDGRARRGRSAASRAARRATLGNFWVDLYRSLVYILLPLALDPRA